MWTLAAGLERGGTANACCLRGKRARARDGEREGGSDREAGREGGREGGNGRARWAGEGIAALATRRASRGEQQQPAAPPAEKAHLLEQAEQHVRVDGALVRLVQDDDAVLRQLLVQQALPACALARTRHARQGRAALQAGCACVGA